MNQPSRIVPALKVKQPSLKGSHFLLIYLTAGLAFMGTYVVRSTFNGNPRAQYVDLVYQHAQKPYVYRLITPILIRGVSRVIPDHLEDRINRLPKQYPTLAANLAILRWEQNFLNLYVIGMVIMFLFLLGFMVAFRCFFDDLFCAPLPFTGLAPVMALFLLFPWVNVTYLYDFSSLFFFILCLVLMLRKNWLVYLLIYLLACFNKETILLVTLQFILFEGFHAKLEKHLFWKLLAAQIAGFIFIRLLLMAAFRHLPGGLYEFHLLDHNLPLLAIWIKEFSPGNYLMTLVILIFCLYNWKQQPVFLRYGLWSFIVLVFLTILFGWMNEWRDYLEAFPYFSALVIHNLAIVLKIPISVRKDQLEPASAKPPKTPV